MGNQLQWPWLLMVLFLAACGRGPAVETTLAPQNQDEAGFIIQGAPQDVEAVMAESQSFRVLSKKHGLYEVRGLERAEIKKIAPNLSVERNLYFKSMIERQASPTSLVAYEQVLKGNNVQSQKLPPALEGCNLDAKTKPSLLVSMGSPVLTVTPTMELGETAEFRVHAMAATAESTIVEYRWDVLTPDLSPQVTGVIKAPSLSFTPDTVGFYRAIVVAMDDQNACAIQVLYFLVTHNPVIDFAQPQDNKPTAALESFKHLARIDIEAAWEKATGQGVTIAILDTGLHYNHLGIKFNLATKESERQGTEHQDDDDNGFLDDVLGWDFVNGDNLPFDDEGHGSHVAGLSSSHIYGSAKDSRVMPIKVLNAAGGGDTASVIAGIYYAVDNGAQVINASIQRLSDHLESLKAAIEYANQHQVVFISAAGNDALDLSLPDIEIFPGEIDVPNVVNVAATGFDNKLTEYSNFGRNQVDVAAPGGDQFEPIISLATLNTQNYPFLPSGGTSMAAPIVAGVAALLLQANPNLTVSQVREILMTSGSDIAELTSKVGSGKLLNAAQAVEQAEQLHNRSILF